MERDDTIPHIVLASARKAASRPAIIAEDGTVTTYDALAEAMKASAAAMIAAGVRRGDRVAIWAPNRPEWIIAALGLHMAGAALVPISTRLKAMEVCHILMESEAALLIGAASVDGHPLLPQLDDAPIASVRRIVSFDAATGDDSWADFLAQGKPVSRALVDERLANMTGADVSDVIFTSGTTGAPKGVMTGHAQNVATFRTYGTLLGLVPDDRYLVVNPFFHTFGYKAGWLTSFIAGATVLPHAVFEANRVIERIERERVTVLPGPPTLFHGLLAADRSGRDLSSLRLSITGAATVPLQLVERMKTDLGFATVLTAYGLTESCGVVTMCRAGDPPALISRTAGRAIDGVALKVIDRDGTALPPGQPGELLVRGDNVMIGYLSNPTATAEAIDAEGWLHTGDIAICDAAGYVTITDRAKDMLIVGGFNAYPAEIERLLETHPAIQQSAVVGVPDARLGEVPVAYIVLQPQADATPAQLIAWARANMAGYKAPRRIVPLDAMPLNATGKVQRFLLRDRALAEFGAEVAAG